MTDFEQRYVTARKAVIARDLARLNPMQRQGAMTTEGPLLLLAGAGSGKTTVLIQRVYNLLTYGRGSDSDEVPDWATEEDLDFLEHFPDRPDGDEVRRVHRLCAVDAPRPWEIIAITFTNKAAGELKERLAARLGPAANDVWATFHSACVRILRRDIDRIGFDKDFTIYDTDDAKRVIKDILKEQNLDEKTFPIRSVLSPAFIHRFCVFIQKILYVGKEFIYLTVQFLDVKAVSVVHKKAPFFWSITKSRVFCTFRPCFDILL